jgi:ATP-dependent DNA ligase
MPKSARFPIAPPIEPMLAKLSSEVPAGAGFQFEPKWDGFRAIVFRGAAELFIQSRDLRPLDRYFPELHEALLQRLPPHCVLDGEIVIATRRGLDFDALQLRLHPAASRVATLAAQTPSSFVAFDALAIDGRDLRAAPLRDRRAALERLLASALPPLHLTPATRDRSRALAWLSHFEGAGLDGIVAKALDSVYEPGTRSMTKVKHVRTADCAVAGFRWHKAGRDALVGSLLLGLYDDHRRLHHVGVTSSFTMEKRRQLALELEPLRAGAMDDHPWRDWTAAGFASRWSAGKDLSWEPVRVERVCEVKYDHMQGSRFRHAAIFLRWREDKRPGDCSFEQLEAPPPFELADVFGEVSKDQ